MATTPAVDIEQEVEFYGAALADGTRLQIVDLLCDKEEMTSGEIVEALGPDRTWSNTSQHLGILRRYRVVLTRKHQQFVHYRLASPKLGRAFRAIRRLAQEALADQA